MSNLQFTLVRDEDGDSNITVYQAGNPSPYIAHETHPAWDQILSGVLADDADVIELFDIAKTIGERTALSERLSYGHGNLFFDSDLVDDALTSHIVRTVQADEDYAPLVALFENIALNPSASSREQMYTFLQAHDFTITHDGLIVGYKGVDVYVDVYGDVYDPDGDRVYRSRNAGTAFVNGKVQEGRIEQRIGDVVEMPRAEVVEDPSTGCAIGLHVATFSFAKSFIGAGQHSASAVLEVHVHPRDVVSVPSADEKVRVCRYRIVGVRDKPYDVPVLPAQELVRPVVQAVPDTREDEPQDALVTVIAHPSPRAFRKMQAQARLRKKGFVKYASRKWTLVEGDGSQPEHWAV